MKKVLIIITTAFEPTGGLTTVMMNYYREMDKTGLTIDFASTNEADQVLINEIQSNGSNYYNLGSRKKRPFRYIHRLKKLIKTVKYDVVHVNGNSSTMLMESATAKKCGVQEIICHTHTSQSEYPFIHKLMSPFFKKSYTRAIAVSDKAGRWLFGDSYTVLNNAIDVYKYQYNLEWRASIRKELHIDGKYVLGTVGKLTSSKNQIFLLDVFKEYIKMDENAVLVIVGGGELESELKNKANSLNIGDRVLFLGMRSDVDYVIQSFDIFVFPSLYEGFGMVVLEAQASGLYCMVSSVVPSETKTSSNVEFIDLNKGAVYWAKEIYEKKDAVMDRVKASVDSIDSITECGFNIAIEANRLRKIYLN